MWGKAKWFLIGALVVTMLGFAFFVLGPDKRSPKVQRLPDGTYMRLGEVRFESGNTHTFKTKAVTGWKKKVAPYLPRSLLAELGWTTGSGTLIMAGGKGTNLCISTIWEGPMNSSGLSPRLVVFDENGNSIDSGANSGGLSTSDGTNVLMVNCWCASMFPRRGKMLDLCFYGRTNSGCLAEFVVTNPAFANYPTWTSEPFPISKTNGDMSVTLFSLKSGLSKSDETKVAASNEVVVTQAAYQVMEANGISHSWRLNELKISDATGNEWTTYKETGLPRQRDGMDLFSFDGVLWPGEVWKMRFEFSRVADFAPDEIFTFNGIAVPDATQVMKLQNTTNISGTKIQLTTLTGEKAKLPGNLQYMTKEGFVNFVLHATKPPKDYRLTLVRITDESGREAEINPHVDWEPGELVCGFKPPVGAKELNFTFAFQKRRFVEFLARPEFVRAN